MASILSRTQCVGPNKNHGFNRRIVAHGREDHINYKPLSQFYISGIRSRLKSFQHSKLHLTWWRHQIETFSALLAICAGNSPVTGEFPAQRPVMRSFGVFFDLRLNQQLIKQWSNAELWCLFCAWLSGWVNNGEAGDLRHHRAHYEVTVMKSNCCVLNFFLPNLINLWHPF